MYSSGEEIALEKRQVGTTGARVRPPPSPLKITEKEFLMLRQCRRIGNSFFILREFAFGFYIRIFIMEENETKEGKHMPSTYAHYRMGQEVREKLSGDAKTIIEKRPELYLIGLHGPDILFYFKPLASNAVNSIGYGLHGKTGRSFFENASDVIEKSTDKEGALSYVYGVLNHFALDVTCHKYVDEKIKESGVSHAEIEVEFDRYLMLLDGLNPVKHSLTGHIRPTKENAGVITGFYTGTTEQEVLKALRSMIFYNKLLLAENNVKRKIILDILRKTGNYEEMHGLIVSPSGNPLCRDSNEKLFSLYQMAVERGKDFITDFMQIYRGEKPYPDVFELTFAGIPESEEKR